MRSILHIIQLLFLFILLSRAASAQGIHQLWGMTTDYGRVGKGAIFRTSYNGRSLSQEHAFDFAKPGTNGCRELTEYNGEFYATVYMGGSGFLPGVIMKWNPVTNIYTTLHEFDETAYIPDGKLFVLNNKIYGITAAGGVNDAGVIFELDLSTGTFTRKFEMGTLLNGQYVSGHAFSFFNGKFYGVVKNISASDEAVFFEWDPTTNTVTKKLNVSGSGSPSPYYAMAAYNGKLYGVATPTPGGNGVIFEWDLSLNKYTVKKSFAGGNQGYLPFAELSLKDNKFYGITGKGGLNDKGVIFEWDPVTNGYTKKVDLPTAASGVFNFSPMTLLDGKFYSTGMGGPNGKGYIYEWDPATNNFSIRFDFAGQSGTDPQTKLVPWNGKFYCSTYYGGKYDGGIMFSWDPVSGSFAKQFDFNESNGHMALNSLTLRNSKLYGMTSLGGSENAGVLFEFSPKTKVYKRLQDFDATKGANPEGNLTLKDGKFYGMTKKGGANDAGTLFEWDVENNIFTKKFDFGGANGAMPTGSLTVKDGKLYGMTAYGGTNDYGVIFEWDPDLNNYAKRLDLSEPDGGRPYGDLTLKDGKFYGLTFTGGANHEGVLFEWDPATNVYIKKQDLDAGKGIRPYGSLLLDNNLFYGVTSMGGTEDRGVAFQWDPATNIFTKKVNIYAYPSGYGPRSSPVMSYGKIYFTTSFGGAEFGGSIIEWDLALNTLSNPSSFNVPLGRDPIYTSLVKAPVSISAGNPGSCILLPQVFANAGNAQSWIPVTDKAGNAVAEINPNGTDLGGIFPSLYVHNGPVRSDQHGQYYLNRNLTIQVSKPDIASGTQVDIRFYIKQEEFDALMAANNSTPGAPPITDINDLGIFKSNGNDCTKGFTAPAYPVNSTIEPYDGGYIFKFSVSTFSTFYIASKNYLALPVKLSGFQARLEENNGILNWQTTEEVDFSHFEIQRSANGKDFVQIGEVNPDTYKTAGKYTFTDKGLAEVNGTNAYYRLKMIDIDGSFAYSSMVQLTLPVPVTALYPNPASDFVHINLSPKIPSIWHLVDSQGNEIAKGEERTGKLTIDTRQLLPGFYILKVKSNDGSRSFKVVKK